MDYSYLVMMMTDVLSTRLEATVGRSPPTSMTTPQAIEIVDCTR
jgi:hypothetical protein